MRVHTVLSLLGAAATFPTSTLAWGVVGHEVVATIAQIFLHDSTEAAIKDILPDWTGGKLAPVAACSLLSNVLCLKSFYQDRV